nr:cation/H(+) antiporter 4-like [Malus domestica]
MAPVNALPHFLSTVMAILLDTVNPAFEAWIQQDALFPSSMALASALPHFLRTVTSILLTPSIQASKAGLTVSSNIAITVLKKCGRALTGAIDDGNKVPAAKQGQHLCLPKWNYTLPVLEFEMTLIYIVTQLTHLFLNMFGLPVLAAQLVNDAWRGMRDIGVMIIYTLSVFCVFRPIMFWIVKRTPEGSPVKDSYIFFILLAFLGSGLFSHWCELPIVIGPLILGFAVPDGPPLGATLVKKLDFMVNRVFMPVFVTTSLMRVTVSLEMPPAHRRVVLGTAIVTFVIFLSKFAASMVTPLCCKMPLRHAVALALIMTSKGVVEIAAYTIAKDTWVIVSGVFNHMMFTVLLSAIVVPPLVKYLYDPKKKYAGYHRKALLNSKPNSELRILACINRADNTPAIINLIDASCPTRESPIGLYVLHLIELVARTTSVLISHNLQTRALSNYSYSDNIIRSFVQFMKENEEAVFVHVFTAISPSLYMYDDVCTLALDKNTSLIILPFHRKWSVTNGSIESENQAARTLNCRVLETAPCSVGILVNRGHVKCTNSSVSPAETYRVALVFIGGSDDWEALMFAKRMLRDACISLTVIRLVYASEDKESFTKWEVVQDNEMLKEVRHNGTGYVSYVEEHVADSTQTTRKIRSLMDEDEYDLYIVGRRYNMRSPQTLGLEQWSEFPELGVIGDMLASADYCCKFSVLVIQHQQQGTSS